MWAAWWNFQIEVVIIQVQDGRQVSRHPREAPPDRRQRRQLRGEHTLAPVRAGKQATQNRQSAERSDFQFDTLSRQLFDMCAPPCIRLNHFQSNGDAMLRTVMQRLDVRASVNAVNSDSETALLKAGHPTVDPNC